MRSIQKGFTLIELMIVIAIIGILAAVAIPAYTDYTQRAQVSEAVSLMGGLKTPIAEFFADKGLFPTTATLATDLGATVTGKYTATITASGGTGNPVTAYTLTATMRGVGTVGRDVADKTMLLTTTNGKTFTCLRGDVPNKYLPQACR